MHVRVVVRQYCRIEWIEISALQHGCVGWVLMLRRTSRKNRLAVDTQRFCQSFAIRLSRTKHGPDEANDHIG